MCLLKSKLDKRALLAAAMAKDASGSGDGLKQLHSGQQHGEIARGRTLLIVSAAGGYKYDPPKHHDQRKKRLESKQIR